MKLLEISPPTVHFLWSCHVNPASRRKPGSVETNAEREIHIAGRCLFSRAESTRST
jgi:hypothetical protein